MFPSMLVMTFRERQTFLVQIAGSERAQRPHQLQSIATGLREFEMTSFPPPILARAVSAPRTPRATWTLSLGAILSPGTAGSKHYWPSISDGLRAEHALFVNALCQYSIMQSE